MYLLFALYALRILRSVRTTGFSRNWVKPFPKMQNTIINMKFIYNGTGVKRYFVYDVINGEEYGRRDGTHSSSFGVPLIDAHALARVILCFVMNFA